MLVALDEDGQVFNVLENPAPQGSFSCPGCGGPVRYKSGKVLRSHFAHVTLRDCTYFSENESAQHLSLKSCLYSWLINAEQVELEKCLPSIGQVADLFVNNSLALEVQCSSLPISRLQLRTQAYHEADLQVLWLLGKGLWIKERLSKLHKQFLSFSMNMGFHLWELDDEKKELRLRYLIHEDLRGKVHCLTKAFPFGQGNLLDILRLPFAKQALSYFTCSVDQDLLDYVAKQLYYRVPKWMSLQAEAYQQGKNLLSQSLDDFYPQIRLPRSAIGFAQIKQDLTPIYQAFDLFYDKAEDKRKQILYPPIIYRKPM
ncbi:competence protein CoiA [Streptococcus suis]|uniref:Competence CoiA family protein n=1 Tax=Streptococcus suis R61 TaxID=996306 RepID=A0AA87F6Y4_STRSU|nr:competence protein CoiA family protein [Streptococcus suis]ATZ03160.1 competence protein CoiA [Streptococcus suis]EHC02045.1 Competence CoiA family protein [Streptococcus suis R61]MBY5000877.1 competence protein CoiA [Streptococcus suis]MBY5011799.1 competence protein CoiA [Streptococcus suis]MBY5018664.1 competence protein CoiA [Streptococcus suis]